MERTLKVKATQSEIERMFEFDEIINIRYFERVGNDIYKIITRLPECEMEEYINFQKLSTFKNKVIEACQSDLKVIGKGVYSDGSARIIYSNNEYWNKEYANIYAEKNKTTLVEYKIVNKKY